MAIWVIRIRAWIVQGLTGREGTFTPGERAYGTHVLEASLRVRADCPRRLADLQHVQEAVDKTGANASVIFRAAAIRRGRNSMEAATPRSN